MIGVPFHYRLSLIFNVFCCQRTSLLRVIPFPLENRTELFTTCLFLLLCRTMENDNRYGWLVFGCSDGLVPFVFSPYTYISISLTSETFVLVISMIIIIIIIIVALCRLLSLSSRFNDRKRKSYFDRMINGKRVDILDRRNNFEHGDDRVQETIFAYTRGICVPVNPQLWRLWYNREIRAHPHYGIH